MRRYDEAKVEAILDLLRAGVSLSKACERVSETIGRVSFDDWHKWIDCAEGRAADLEGRYLRARELRCHILADEIIDLTDSATPENAHVMRLRVDTRKWLVSKVLPKLYGDRLQVDTTVRAVDPREIPTAELVAMVRQQQRADKETRH